jgi:hypothetical protein
MHYHGEREIHDESYPHPVYLWTRRLGLAMANKDQDMYQVIADEIGDCLECWQSVAYNLADRWVTTLHNVTSFMAGKDSPDRDDYPATYIAACLAKAYDGD